MTDRRLRRRLCTGLAALVLVSLTILPSAAAQAQPKDEPAVTATDLLQPGSFPNAAYGMALEDAQEQGDVARVRTTGAEFVIDKAKSQIECRQRIAAQRAVARISLPAGALRGLKLAHRSSGAAVLDSPAGATIRINGDSLLMIKPGVDGPITAELTFTPDYHSQFEGNFNFFDPQGGISFFDHGTRPKTQLQAATDPVRVTWDWKGGDVLWAGVSPPKAYDWEKSFKQRIVMRGTSAEQYMYPDELTLRMLALNFNVLYLHTENIWRNWQTELIPKNEQEYLRVARTAAGEGLPIMVYAGPKHYIDGTVAEARATDDVDDPRSGGWTSGSNAKLFVFEAKRLVERYRTSGLYFDEMYCSARALASSYYVTRACRELLGDSGPFVFHATEDVIGDRKPGDLVGKTHCPTIHAYFDGIYKGEGIGMPGQPTWHNVEEKFPGYTRYNAGTYNISNSIALPILDRGSWIDDKPLLDLLMKRANGRFIMPEGFLYTDKSAAWWRDYVPRLKPGLKEQLEPTLLQRTGVFDRWRKSNPSGAAAAAGGNR